MFATMRHAVASSTTTFLTITLPPPCIPLFLDQVHLTVMVRRRWRSLKGIFHRLEPTRQICDGQCRYVEQSCDRNHNLLEMLGNTVDSLFHYLRLFDLVTEGGESQCHAVKTHCSVLNRLPLLEGHRVELLPQVLSRRLPYAVIADPHGGDSLPGLLGCFLVYDQWPHFWLHDAAKRIECLHVFMGFDAPFLNGSPEQLGSELDLHEHRLVGVVGLGEHWESGVGAHLTNHPLDHAIISFCHSMSQLPDLDSNGCTLPRSSPGPPTFAVIPNARNP